MMTTEEKREKNRIKNINWRAKDRKKYNQSMNEWRAHNPDKVTKYKWKERYGITPEQYTELFVGQKGCCAICGNPEIAKHNKTQKIQKLAVDHCHKSGKVRGLLCQDCNRGLGKFYDDTSRLAKAINYLTNQD